MKNHVAFKFAAVLLSALLLLTAIASGCGIILLSDYDLYNQTWEEGYEENMRTARDEFAQALIFRHASMELGGKSEPGQTRPGQSAYFPHNPLPRSGCTGHNR